MKVTGKSLLFKRVWAVLPVVSIGLLSLLFSGCGLSKTAYLELEPQYENVLKKRYLLDQNTRVFSQDFTIQERNGTPYLKVKKKPFSVKNRYRLLDMNGEERGRISENLFNFKSRYKVYRAETLAATVTRHGFFKTWYSVDVPGGAGFKITNHSNGYKFRFSRDRKVFAMLSRRYYPGAESYCLDMVPGEDDFLLLAAAVIINHADPDINREKQAQAGIVSNYHQSAHARAHEESLKALEDARKIHEEHHKAHMAAHNAAVNR